MGQSQHSGRAYEVHVADYIHMLVSPHTTCETKHEFFGWQTRTYYRLVSRPEIKLWFDTNSRILYVDVSYVPRIPHTGLYIAHVVCLVCQHHLGFLHLRLPLVPDVCNVICEFMCLLGAYDYDKK